MGRIPLILLDTHVLLWSLLQKSRLSTRAKELIDKETELAVSSISIWEVGIKNSKGQLPLPFDVEEMVYHLKHDVGMQIIPVDENIWLRSIRLEWEHRDPADRVIVATARITGMQLISADSLIRDYYSRTVW